MFENDQRLDEGSLVLLETDLYNEHGHVWHFMALKGQYGWHVSKSSSNRIDLEQYLLPSECRHMCVRYSLSPSTPPHT